MTSSLRTHKALHLDAMAWWGPVAPRRQDGSRSPKGRTSGTLSSSGLVLSKCLEAEQDLGPSLPLRLHEQAGAGADLVRKEVNRLGDMGVPTHCLGCLQGSKDS